MIHDFYLAKGIFLPIYHHCPLRIPPYFRAGYFLWGGLALVGVGPLKCSHDFILKPRRSARRCDTCHKERHVDSSCSGAEAEDLKATNWDSRLDLLQKLNLAEGYRLDPSGPCCGAICKLLTDTTHPFHFHRIAMVSYGWIDF